MRRWLTLSICLAAWSCAKAPSSPEPAARSVAIERAPSAPSASHRGSAKKKPKPTSAPKPRIVTNRDIPIAASPPPPPPPPPPASVVRVAPRPVTPEPDRSNFRDDGANPFVDAATDPLSTFAIDVDTASYTLARRMLTEGYLPPEAAIRVEEFVNYLPYTYAPPEKGDPFAVDLDAAPNPFDEGPSRCCAWACRGAR